MTLRYLLELIRQQESTEGCGSQCSHPEAAQVPQSSDMGSNPASHLKTVIFSLNLGFPIWGVILLWRSSKKKQNDLWHIVNTQWTVATGFGFWGGFFSQLFQVQFTQHKIHQFFMYNSMSFDKCVYSCITTTIMNRTFHHPFHSTSLKPPLSWYPPPTHGP